MKITERDKKIIREAIRWKGLLGRQIKILGGFSGQRATDRRLQKLIQEQLLVRKHIIYGLPGLYIATKKAVQLINLELSISKIRLEQIYHDIAVVDTAIYFIITGNEIKAEEITTEKELRQELGFTPRAHLPDFVYSKDGKKYCVEVEISLKAKNRLENNVKDNYIKYDIQQWIIPDNKPKIKQSIEQLQHRYSNIEILSLEVIQNHVQNYKQK